MAVRLAARWDGIEAAVIVTPNHLHFPVAKAFLEAGIDAICDKPLSTTLAEAAELVELTRAKGLIFAVTLNNTGYPMVRQARETIAGGAIGDIRVVHAAYLQDWLTLPIDFGAFAIGVHAHSLALFVTGLELEAVSADFATFVPGRRLDDAHVLMRFVGGARGALAASQVAVGKLNNLSLKVYGALGSNGRARSRKRFASRPMASRPASCSAAAPEIHRLRSKARACRAAIPKDMWKASPTSTAGGGADFCPPPAARPRRARN
jgi:predicted dehydrogenase